MVCPEKKVIARVAAALTKLWDGQEERRKVSVQSGQGIGREQSVFTSVQSLNNSKLGERRWGMSNSHTGSAGQLLRLSDVHHQPSAFVLFSCTKLPALLQSFPWG